MDNDLISRELILREARRLIDYDEVDEGRLYCHINAVEVAAIKAAPSVEVAIQKHGHWIHCKGKSNLWYCSECGEKIIYNPTRKTYMPEKKPVHEVNRYCRGCGAKMEMEK